jgi:multidrug efflux pump
VLRRLTGNRPLKRHGEIPHVEAFRTPVAGGGGSIGAVPAAPRSSRE